MPVHLKLKKRDEIMEHGVDVYVGEVYKGLWFAEVVVLKKIISGQMSEVLKEASVWKTLNHPKVVRVRESLHFITNYSFLERSKMQEVSIL